LVRGVILATSFGYFIFSRIVLTDMLFTTLLAVTCWGVLRGLLDPAPRRGPMLGAYAAMALAILTKGLIGLAFPVLTIGAFLLIIRDSRLLRRLELLRGSAVFLAVAAPWHILVGLKNPDFFWFYFVNEHVLRFVAKRHLLDYAPMPLYAYLIMVVVWTFPWSAFLPVALRRYWPRSKPTSREDRGFLFILLWAASVVGFFALTPSRLEYYSMPAFPALALCVGRLWGAEMAPRSGRALASGLSYSCFGLLTVAVGLLPASWLFPRLENVSLYNMFTAMDAYSRDIQYGILSNAEVYTVPSYEELVPLLQWATLILLVGVASATLAWLRRRPGVTVACLAATMLPTLTFVQTGIVMFEPHRSIVRLADVIVREFRPGDEIIIEGPYENFASANFYTGQRARVLHGLFGDLEFGSRYPEETWSSGRATPRRKGRSWRRWSSRRSGGGRGGSISSATLRAASPSCRPLAWNPWSSGGAGRTGCLPTGGVPEERRTRGRRAGYGIGNAECPRVHFAFRIPNSTLPAQL
ncbi:MAG: glycosyltransferase family 39 protein, partial [candidate division NC10 bacterium]|nr:glycosyltransferase family 39 protein [candidate division NC10 bacterium]